MVTPSVAHQLLAFFSATIIFFHLKSCESKFVFFWALFLNIVGGSIKLLLY